MKKEIKKTQRLANTIASPKKNWFKTRKTTLSFAITALVGGFLFLEPNITGNTLINNASSFNLTSIIGFLLIFCSIILATYSLKKK